MAIAPTGPDIVGAPAAGASTQPWPSEKAGFYILFCVIFATFLTFFDQTIFGMLAERIKARTGSRSEIVIIPYDQAYEAGFEDMLRRAPDITKIQRLIGYRPGLGLPEMLERVISYERERRE